MQMITFLTPEGTTYCALSPRSASDVSIPDKPADMPQGQYNREMGVWERGYEKPTPEDITIGEAEQLWAKAREGDVLAAIMLKVAGL